MSDSVVGNCLHLYLENYSLISGLEEQEFRPPELKEEEKLLTAFSARASDQATGLLEGLYIQLGAILPYRSVQRRSQRRTVREQWRMDGSFLRPREKMVRTFWSLYLGALRDKGPAACLILGPIEPNDLGLIEGLAGQTASLFGMESANAQTCFGHDSGYKCGIVVGAATLSPSSSHDAVAAAIKEDTDRFFAKYKTPFEQAIDGA